MPAFREGIEMNLEEIKSRINPAYADCLGTESYERLCDRIDKLTDERDALALAVENSGNRHIYEAPDGMVFMPEGTPQEITTLKAALREMEEYFRGYEFTDGYSQTMFARVRSAIGENNG
jgi:hypothetical protein